MARIEITDLNEDTTITEDEIKHVKGGAGFINFDGIDGESLNVFNKIGVQLDGSVRYSQTYK